MAVLPQDVAVACLCLVDGGIESVPKDMAEGVRVSANSVGRQRSAASSLS